MRLRPIEDRFWEKVDRRSDEECWEWTAALTSNGYGKLNRGGRGCGEIYAHRLSFEMHTGPIPDGYVIDHKCHNTACVNPAHLQAVTQKQNMENLALRVNNRSGVRGVHWSKNAKKWHAIVHHDKRTRHIGYFSSLADAEAAVVAARNEVFTNNLADREPAA